VPGPGRRVVAVGRTWPGNRNDVVVFRGTLGRTLLAHPRLSGDGGRRGIGTIRSPRRGPDGKIIKTWRSPCSKNTTTLTPRQTPDLALWDIS
jgi:hypothetical protein